MWTIQKRATTCLLFRSVRTVTNIMSESKKIVVVAPQKLVDEKLVHLLTDKRVDFTCVCTNSDAQKIPTNIKTLDGVLYVVPVSTDILDTLWKRFPNTKWLHSFFAGCDALVPFMDRTGLINTETFKLSNGRGAFSESLAEFALMSILHFNKNVPKLQINQQMKRWDKFYMNTMSNKTISFLGFGDIAQETAKLLRRTFGEKITMLALKKHQSKTEFEGLINKEYLIDEEHDEIYQRADFVISTLPGTRETKNFVGRLQFELMKETAAFISLGRGTVVDEEALNDALKNGKIGGAALDVFQVEPLPQTSPLWEAPNILISSHNADLTTDYFKLGFVVFQKNLDAIVEGRELVTPVNKKLGY